MSFGFLSNKKTHQKLGRCPGKLVEKTNNDHKNVDEFMVRKNLELLFTIEISCLLGSSWKNYNSFYLFYFYPQSEDGKVVYKCKLCHNSRIYTDLVNVLEHIPAVHEGKKKYPCKFCQKSFTSLVARRNHEKVAKKSGICPKNPTGSVLANVRKFEVCFYKYQSPLKQCKIMGWSLMSIRL